MNLHIYIGEKIKFFRTLHKMTQTDLADKLHTTKQTISRYEKGQRSADQDVLFELCHIFNVSINEFFPIDSKQQSTSINNNDTHTHTKTIRSIIDVSVQLEDVRQHNVLEYATEQLNEQNNTVHDTDDDYVVDFRQKIAVTEAVAAGRGFSYGDNEVNYCYTDKEHLPHFDIASYITGDSMAPEYHDGDVVLIRKEMYSSPNVYVVDYDGKSYLKKVYQEKDKFRLVSFNKKYDDIIIDLPLDDDVYLNIVGRVVGSFTPVE